MCIRDSSTTARMCHQARRNGWPTHNAHCSRNSLAFAVAAWRGCEAESCGALEQWLGWARGSNRAWVIATLQELVRGNNAHCQDLQGEKQIMRVLPMCVCVRVWDDKRQNQRNNSKILPRTHNPRVHVRT
eukprot:1798932-Amphidinium_carterae.1